MWYRLRASEINPDFTSSATELLQSTLRHIILIVGGVYLVWHLFAMGAWPDTIGSDVWLIAPVVVLTVGLSIWLLPGHLLAAQIVWQVGLAATTTLAIHVFQRQEIALFYALLPLMAVVTVGWPAGLVIEGLVIALVWWLPRNSAMPELPVAYGLAVVTGGAFAGLLGWASVQALLTATQWSLSSLTQAHKNMEDARQHRAELARVLKDLDRAYHSLERANHMLILARTEAEEARGARNRFALAISHELRTPLNFILGFSELMVNSPTTYAELGQWPLGLYEDIQEVYRSTTHLSCLVNDVLDLGQIEALQMMLIKDWVDPTQIVQEVEDMVRPALARKGLSLQTEVEPGLPSVFVDRTRIRQVLLNLVSNSLRFTEQGGVTITAQTQGDEQRLLFCVRDTGPGIAKEDISKIFEEFGQAGRGSWRRHEGTGLGIPIGRRFVELHGGRMWVESQVGQGTVFYFSLPLLDSARDKALLSDRPESDVRYWQHLREKAEKEKTVLVLSPDPSAGEVIAPYAEDYHVTAVQRADQVICKVAELLPSALILDQSRIQNEEIRHVAQGLPYDLPVIGFAFPGSPSRPRHLPEGVSNYLVKPIGRQDLVEAVKALGPDVRSLLVVDDDPAMMRFVSLALKSVEETASQGSYHLALASTGAEALDRLREHKPDAMLLDLSLPDVSGWEVLEELRQSPDPGQVAVILITAHDWPQALAAGGGEALRVTMRRPLSRQELASILGNLLDSIQMVYPAAPVGPVRSADASG